MTREKLNASENYWKARSYITVLSIVLFWLYCTLSYPLASSPSLLLLCSKQINDCFQSSATSILLLSRGMLLQKERNKTHLFYLETKYISIICRLTVYSGCKLGYKISRKHCQIHCIDFSRSFLVQCKASLGGGWSWIAFLLRHRIQWFPFHAKGLYRRKLNICLFLSQPLVTLCFGGVNGTGEEEEAVGQVFFRPTVWWKCHLYLQEHYTEISPPVLFIW